MPYADLEELRARLDYTLSVEEEQAATAALEDASNLAQFYGRPWPEDAAPPLVKTIVLNAVQRYMRLIEAAITSRAGDEQLTWTDLREKTGTVFLDDEQQRMLKQIAGNSGSLWSVPIAAFGSSLEPYHGGDTYVETDRGGDPLPFWREYPW